MSGEDRPEASSKQQSLEWNRLRIFHWVIWIPTVLYILWYYSASPANAIALQRLPSAFTNGSYGLRRAQDVSDRSMKYARAFILQTSVWCIVQAALSQTLFQGQPQLRARFYSVFSLLVLAWKLCWESMLVFLVTYVAFFLLAGLRSRAACYAVTISALLFPNLTDEYDPLLFVWERRGSMMYHLTTVTAHWNVLRCMSFSVDFVVDPESSKRRFPDFWTSLAYVFYLPSSYTGPVMNYDNFVAQLEQPAKTWTLGELLRGLTGLVRVASHMVLFEVMNHYFYSSALTRLPGVVASMDLRSLVGYGVCLNFMFYIKYLVIYGASGALARLDRVWLPPPPKCIARGHLCSHFWRYFDHGLHLWIRRYFYEPLVGGRRSAVLRFAATAVCFGFVCLWHNMTEAVRLWTALNFLGICLEIVAAAIRRTGPCQHLEVAYVHGSRLRILKAVLGSGHYLLTIYSCLLFLTDMEVGRIFLRKVILGFPLPIVPILVYLYIASHVSMDVMDWEKVPKAASN